jgi:hypothetical protein
MPDSGLSILKQAPASRKDETCALVVIILYSLVVTAMIGRLMTARRDSEVGHECISRCNGRVESVVEAA